MPTHRGWSRPGKRTTDRGRFLTTLTGWSAFTVAGTAPEFRRLPFEPPPASKALVDGTLIRGPATLAADGLSNCLEQRYSAVMTANHSRLIALLSAILAAAALRLVPHPPNFSPIGAMALFSGAYLGRRGLALVAPLAALFLSDLVLGALALRRASAARVGFAALASSVLFFVLTNLGMWLFSGFYPRTLAGLETCYIAAIPFFQNTLAGDLFYAALLFGGFAVAERMIPQIRGAGAAQPA
jgi:hypothetical protein